MNLSKLLVLIAGCMTMKCVIATESYDNIPITPTTWKEADLTYVTSVNGESCVQTANILRPIIWLNKQNLIKNNIGKSVRLTKNDIGTDTEVKLVAIKPVTFSFDDKDASKSVQRPVIGTFKKCSNQVTDYMFQGKSGTETIKATPEHPFYSLKQNDYVPIGNTEFGTLISTSDGNNVKLMGSQQHGGKKEYVYNFEVYKAHNYLVGDARMLVHNGCDDLKTAMKNFLTNARSVFSGSETQFAMAHGPAVAMAERRSLALGTNNANLIGTNIYMNLGNFPSDPINTFLKSGAIQKTRTGTYRIVDKDAYLNVLSDLYAEDLGTNSNTIFDNGQWINEPLHTSTRQLISDGLGHNYEFTKIEGYPGKHAEIRAVNGQFIAGAPQASDVFVATLRTGDGTLGPGFSLYPQKYPNYNKRRKHFLRGDSFDACTNCTTLLNAAGVTVYTPTLW